MTYPPQGPYGQQPPGANGPQGGYPGGYQQGGYQQGGPPQGAHPAGWGQPAGGQPGQYGAPGPYGQPGQQAQPGQQGQPGPYGQPGQYGPYGAPPRFGGPPPKKKKTALIAGVGVAVLVVAALLFTGFVAPGFFRSGGSTQAGGGSPSGSEAVGGSGKEIPTQQSLPTDVPTTGGGGGTGGTGGGPDEAGFLVFAQSAVDALNTKDFDKIIAITCDKPSAQEAEEEKRRLAENDVRATITGTPTVTGNSGTVDIQLVTGGRTEQSDLDGTYVDGAWCGGDPE